jgi:hypothetical protein
MMQRKVANRAMATARIGRNRLLSLRQKGSTGYAPCG